MKLWRDGAGVFLSLAVTAFESNSFTQVPHLKNIGGTKACVKNEKKCFDVSKGFFMVAESERWMEEVIAKILSMYRKVFAVFGH